MSKRGRWLVTTKYTRPGADLPVVIYKATREYRYKADARREFERILQGTKQNDNPDIIATENTMSALWPDGRLWWMCYGRA